MEQIRSTPHIVSPRKKRIPDPRISVRLGSKLQAKLARVVKRTGHEESHLVRAALLALFATKSDSEITAAVIEARTTLLR